MNFDLEYNFNELVEDLLNEYDFEYHYDEDEDLYITGVTFDEVGDVTLLLMNNGSKIHLVGEFDYTIDNDLVYYRVSDFIHRFNSMDCIVTLFLDPDARRLYFKKQTDVMNVVDLSFTFSRNFFRSNLEMDMFGKAIHGVVSGVLSDVEAIALVNEAIEQFNNEMYEDTEEYMN